MVTYYGDYLSDIECNEETNSFAVEWDGIYGKHWQCFDTKEAMNAAIAKQQRELCEYEVEKILEDAVKKQRYINFNFEIGKKWPNREEAKVLVDKHNFLMKSARRTRLATTFTLGEVFDFSKIKFA